MNMDIGGVQNWQADKIDKKQLKKTLNSNHSSVKYISKVNIVHDYHIRVGDGK